LLAHFPQAYSNQSERSAFSPNKQQEKVERKPAEVPPPSAGPKNFKIPPLKLPSNNLEMVGLMTRSTRRVDPFKSFSTNSNRFSYSIDSAVKVNVKTGENHS
jgi:Tfp pilus assembly protein PilP